MGKSGVDVMSGQLKYQVTTGGGNPRKRTRKTIRSPSGAVWLQSGVMNFGGSSWWVIRAGVSMMGADVGRRDVTDSASEDSASGAKKKQFIVNKCNLSTATVHLYSTYSSLLKSDEHQSINFV